MNKFAATVLLTGALIAATSAGSAHGASADAGIVVDRYLDALHSGDVDDLQQILGGALLQKRQVLLDNPDYAGHLADEYRGWAFEVLEIRATGSPLLEADYLMRRDDGAEHIRKRLFLQPSADGLPYRVVAERTLQ